MDVAFDVYFADFISHFDKNAYERWEFCAIIKKNNEDRVAFGVNPDCSGWLATRFFYGEICKKQNKTEWQLSP